MAHTTHGLRLDELGDASRKAAGLFERIYTELEQRPVTPQASPEQVRALFTGSLEEQGVGLVRALEDFETKVLPHSLGIAHPLYMGLVNSSPLPGAALADSLVSALNNNAGAFHQSPAMTACEEEVCRSFVRLVGLPDTAAGMVLPGGTFANLQALAVARSACRLTPEQAPLARLYVSEAAHFSVSRAARVVGFSAKQIIRIPMTGRDAMEVEALQARLEQDLREGLRPVAVVATLGTTGTGGIDPLSSIADVCARHGVWLHVDACYGGAALLLPELRGRLAGVARADSVAIDPHKWFFIPMTAGLLLLREPKHGLEAFDEAASYIPGADTEAWRWGIPASRRASGFVIWMGLRAHGWETLRQAVRGNIALSRTLERGLSAAGLEVLPGGELSVVCARSPGQNLTPEAEDARQVELARRVSASGRAWFATVRHRGRSWLRFNLVNLHVQAYHVERMIELVASAAREG
ncbi:MAG TPA: pyridoxal-dependent decarboxylase [Myxococcaceae bacterium]|jgi:aromatic-L-amino-acid decarboxylase